VSYLLDTHALLWSFIAPASLSQKVSKILAEEANVLWVSAVSAWEISTKVRRGRLPEAEAFEGRFLEAIEEAGYSLLAIDAEAALRAGRFKAAHRDPFDRMIAAQAVALDIPIISKDTKLDLFPIRRIW
jgi:PIN domain nuclease of toxin-antitoxin system